MTTQSANRQFESKVRKIRERTSGPVESTDDLGISLEKIRRKTDTPLKENRRWEKPSDRPSPQEDYESLVAFAQKSSSELEAMDRDISSLNEIEEEANSEAYSSLLGITEGNNARRALESDERVVDKLRHEALEAGEDENVAENIDESVSNNIESLEKSVDGIRDALTSSLSSYAEDFEEYMEDMAGLARDQYGAMAQMTDYLQELDELDTSSELGEMTVDYLKNETADILATQTQNVSEIYNEMVKATESTKRLQKNADADVRDRYDADLEMLSDSIEYAEETLSNMAGDYSDFGERAEAMIAENTRNIDSFELSAVESWESETGVKSI